MLLPRISYWRNFRYCSSFVNNRFVRFFNRFDSNKRRRTRDVVKAVNLIYQSEEMNGAFMVKWHAGDKMQVELFVQCYETFLCNEKHLKLESYD